MTDIRKLERAIIQPTLMLDFINMSEKRDCSKHRLIKDIVLGILIALVIMQ